MKRYALDWFEASIYGDFECIDWVNEYINKNLSFDLKDGAGNPFYYSSYVNKDFGFTIFKDVRESLKNPPLFIRLTGKFFVLAKSHNFIDDLLMVLNALQVRVSLCRVDVAIDFIKTEYENVICLDEVIPEPDKKLTAGISALVDIHAYKNKASPTGMTITGWDCGKNDSRIRVYNKLFECPKYVDMYGLSEDIIPFGHNVVGVWRLEYQFRGDSLKNLEQKLLLDNTDIILSELLGQCGRRFIFDGFDLEASMTSAYIRKDRTDAGVLNYYERNFLSWFRRYNQISVKLGVRESQSSSILETMAIADFDKIALENEEEYNENTLV